MSKPLKSMTTTERDRAISRRLREKRGGLGHLSAKDATERQKESIR